MATKPLNDLTAAEVGALLRGLELGSYATAFTELPMTGADLAMCEDSDLEGAGMKMALHRKRFAGKLEEFKGSGVPMSLLVGQAPRPSAVERPTTAMPKIIDVAKSGNIDALKKMIDEGAMVNYTNEYGKSALHFACAKGHKEICQILIENDADVKSSDEDGWTALHYAAAFGRKDVASLLLEAGADTKTKDNDGESPLDLAKERNKGEIVALLTGGGAATAPSSVASSEPDERALIGDKDGGGGGGGCCVIS